MPPHPGELNNSKAKAETQNHDTKCRAPHRQPHRLLAAASINRILTDDITQSWAAARAARRGLEQRESQLCTCTMEQAGAAHRDGTEHGHSSLHIALLTSPSRSFINHIGRYKILPSVNKTYAHMFHGKPQGGAQGTVCLLHKPDDQSSDPSVHGKGRKG